MHLHSEKEKEGGGGDPQNGKPDEEEDKTEDATSHTERKSHQEATAELKHSTREKDEEKEEIKNRSPEGVKEEEKEDIERRDDVTEKATNSNNEEVDRMKSEVILHKHPLILLSSLTLTAFLFRHSREAKIQIFWEQINISLPF